jgi:glycosyltransferase involved in cell wall biosynthesis
VPRVSVVIPHYNAAHTIEATLASVLAQSIAAIEVVIVDDGSDAAVRVQLVRLAASDARVRLLFQTNHGVSAARNAGILAARAPVIAFMDADDLWPGDHLAVHLARLHDDPDLDVSFSGARFIDRDGHVVGAARPQMTGLDAATLLGTNPTTCTSTWVVRRAVFETAGLFDVSLRHSEDQEWLVRAALAGAKIEGESACVIDYRTAVGGLASDLQRMRAGYTAMLAAIGARAPALVARFGADALAREDRYLARQALRLNLPRATVRRYIRDCLARAPSLALREPRQTLGVVAAALMPSFSFRR